MSTRRTFDVKVLFLTPIFHRSMTFLFLHSGTVLELLEVLQQNLTMADMMALVMGNMAPVGRLRGRLQEFVRTRALDGQEATPDNIQVSWAIVWRQ